MWKRFVARDGDMIDVLHTDRYTDVAVVHQTNEGYGVLVFSVRNTATSTFYIKAP